MRPTTTMGLVWAALLLPGIAGGAEPMAAERRPQVELAAGERMGELRSDAADRESLTLTIYQRGQALVRERRVIGLAEGRNRVALHDVSPQLRPETVQLRGEAPLRVHQQRLERGVLTWQALLDAHLGQRVELRRDDGQGGDLVVSGVLRGAAGGQAVVELDDGVEVVGAGSAWRIRFPSLPPGLGAVAGLVLELEGEQPGRQAVELSYLSSGLGWQADYVLELDGDRLFLQSWAGIENTTGTGFEQARVRLVAGEPRFARLPAARMALAQADALAEQAAADYRLYELPGRIDLGSAERNQLLLFRAEGIPVEREYRVEGAAVGPLAGVQRAPVTVQLRFRTDHEGIDRALPAGMARVFQRDESGEPLFLGEDHLAATPRGGEVGLTVGAAFDITAEREQTAYRRLGERAEEQGWRLTLRNALERPVTVRVLEHVPGDWTLLHSTHEPSRKHAAQGLEWQLQIPPEGRLRLEYRVEIRR